VTASDACSGTHRVGLAVAALGIHDVPVVNVQGDEPFVEVSDIDAAITAEKQKAGRAPMRLL
jgi:CMP-2-keto-3-deoxyoctulosonic acid synthetase